MNIIKLVIIKYSNLSGCLVHFTLLLTTRSFHFDFFLFVFYLICNLLFLFYFYFFWVKFFLFFGSDAIFYFSSLFGGSEMLDFINNNQPNNKVGDTIIRKLQTAHNWEGTRPITGKESIPDQKTIKKSKESLFQFLIKDNNISNP